MSDPNMDSAATAAGAPDPQTGTPDNRRSLGTTVVGAPVGGQAEGDADTQPLDAEKLMGDSA